MKSHTAHNMLRPWTGRLGLLILPAMVLAGCRENDAPKAQDRPPSVATEPAAREQAIETPVPGDPNQVWTRPRSSEREEDRRRMVEALRDVYGLNDPAVLRAMQNVPRHWFVPETQARAAYIDSPLPIGFGQTISQPYIVAYMTHLLDLDPGQKVLEIGTGSGYQAAVLNEFTPHVFTIEIVRPLGERAIATFRRHGYKTLRVRIGDGYQGWPEEAPFDAIIVTCAPEDIPRPLLDQLKPGGRMVIPVGPRNTVQELVVVHKNADGTVRRESRMPVRFVPLIREKDPR